MKIKGIKQAVGEFNNWKEQARIYFDRESGEVWTDVFPGGNESWSEYHDSSIVEIHSKFLLQDQNNKISMKELQAKIDDEMNTDK